MKWDVKVIDLGVMSNANAQEAVLRELTMAGWELVTVGNFGPSARAYLKREVLTK